jgi:uncharacterized protein (DUF58 family)
MIPERVMRELRYIEVASAKKIRTPRLGAYTSPLRGAGFDFDQHHPYGVGDDVRRIDWNVTARMDQPYLRLTHAERELNVMIAMDASRSMALGSAHDSKREAMMFITASLVFSALANQINTGFLAFADRVLVSSPPRRTRASGWAMLEQCWEVSSNVGRTELVPVVRHLLRALKRTSVIFLISDFMTDDDACGSAELAVLAARHDVIAVVPEDRAERELPAGSGYLTMRDLESGQYATLSLGRRARRHYARQARERREALARAFYRIPIAHVFVPTDESPVEPILALFKSIKA